MKPVSLSVKKNLRRLKEDGLSEQSIKAYWFSLSFFEGKPINADLISDYYKHIKRYNVRTRAACLSRLSRYLKNYYPDLLEHVELFKLPKLLPDNIPTELDVNDVFKAVDGSTFEGIRNCVILTLLYGAGLRRMEVLKLKVAEIDLEKQLIQIYETKNKKDRLVPLSKQGFAVMRRYMRRVRPALNPKCDYVFLNKYGYQMGESTPYQIVKKYGLYGCHKYRHAYATHLLKNGMKESSLQRLLGHSSITTTQIYTRVTIEDIKESYRIYHDRDQWK
jgi:integrase/recombinase XerD